MSELLHNERAPPCMGSTARRNSKATQRAETPRAAARSFGPRGGHRLPLAKSSAPLVADDYLCNPLLNRFQGFWANLILLFLHDALVERRGRKGVRKIREDAQRYLLVTRIGQGPRRGHGVMG